MASVSIRLTAMLLGSLWLAGLCVQAQWYREDIDIYGATGISVLIIVLLLGVIYCAWVVAVGLNSKKSIYIFNSLLFVTGSLILGTVIVWMISVLVDAAGLSQNFM